MKNDSTMTKKRWIRPLPERLVNKIAAGEVIERPSAVLKELVENSFDAGATRIEINIEKSGTKLISVVDNGCGIHAEQLEIAFSRHATSKISDFNDLENLRSYGFRGEALPSIGSVSKTRMITRTADVEVGTEIIIEGGVVQSVKPAASPVGTKVEVRDLFFNTPARRNFLKAESTEARHLTRNAVALALSAPDVRFSYEINDRRSFTLDEHHADMMTRTRALLLGKNGGKLIEVVSESPIMIVRAFLSRPDEVRQNQNSLYVFINNRFIKSQTMIHAVRAGYGELLPKGNYPIGAVFLEIDPIRVDVNVHPTKAEVRLSQERQVHDILYQAVKRSLRGNKDIYSAKVMVDREIPEEQLTVTEAIRGAKSFKPTVNPAASQTVIRELYGHRETIPEPPPEIKDKTDAAISVTADQVAERKTKTPDIDVELDHVHFLGQFSDLYLIFKTGHRLLIIDQHAAHERILYEENLKSIEKGSAISQNLLFPINIELPPERFALYEESSNVLKAAGFIVEPFGTNSILLSAVPTTLTRKSPEKIFHEILKDVENLQKAGYDLKKAVAESVACRAAVMAGDRLGEEEALSLLRQLLTTENRHCCPHGRPTILKISKKELDDKFGRK